MIPARGGSSRTRRSLVSVVSFGWMTSGRQSTSHTLSPSTSASDEAYSHGPRERSCSFASYDRTQGFSSSQPSTSPGSNAVFSSRRLSPNVRSASSAAFGLVVPAAASASRPACQSARNAAPAARA
jgi:hypothetical protein